MWWIEGALSLGLPGHNTEILAMDCSVTCVENAMLHAIKDPFVDFKKEKANVATKMLHFSSLPITPIF